MADNGIIPAPAAQNNAGGEDVEECEVTIGRATYDVRRVYSGTKELTELLAERGNVPATFLFAMNEVGLPGRSGSSFAANGSTLRLLEKRGGQNRSGEWRGKRKLTEKVGFIFIYKHILHVLWLNSSKIRGHIID